MATSGAMVEPSSQGISMQGDLIEDARWKEILRSWLSEPDPVSLLGVGNPIRRDDGVGLEVIVGLRRLLGSHPARRISIPRPPRNPDRLVAKIAGRGERMIIFDAVEANMVPGSITCANLGETKFGLFATHNVPLKVFPQVAANLDRMLIVGIQPSDLELGEGLSEVANNAKDFLVSEVAKAIGGTS